MNADFQPSWFLRNAQVQSVLATKGPRRQRWLRRGSQMEALQQWHVLECADGVRLTGFHSPQPPGVEPRGLVVLIHGWEGSHGSVYLYSIACALHAAGYNVFRLNLRDHAGTHDLNKELFHSARMGEVLDAIDAIRRIDSTAALYVVGFSLGGNFALRVALQGPARGISPRLTVGVSPSIDPGATLRAIDEGPLLFRWYFLDKWRKSLAAKKAAWPDYDFTSYRSLRSFVDATARFVADHTEYPSYEDYLAQYTLTPRMLMDSPAPLAVITAVDDPVIPIRDFAGLEARGSVVSYLETAYGGHCGFIENLGMDAWAERQVLQLFEQA